MPKFKVGVIEKTGGHLPIFNQMRFDTREAAEAYGMDLLARWGAIESFVVLPAEDDKPRRRVIFIVDGYAFSRVVDADVVDVEAANIAATGMAEEQNIDPRLDGGNHVGSVLVVNQTLDVHDVTEEWAEQFSTSNINSTDDTYIATVEGVKQVRKL